MRNFCSESVAIKAGDNYTSDIVDGKLLRGQLLWVVRHFLILLFFRDRVPPPEIRVLSMASIRTSANELRIRIHMDRIASWLVRVSNL